MKVLPILALSLSIVALGTAAVVSTRTQNTYDQMRSFSVPTGTPGRISITGPAGVVKAPRDTLTYTLRWGKAANATSYRVTVTASGSPSGTTTGLPVNAGSTDTMIVFTASNLTYDSLRFVASVSALRNAVVNPTPATANWFVKKLPGVPGSIQVDSSALPASLSGLDVNVTPSTLAVGQFGKGCAFFRFSNGLVGMRSIDAPTCGVTYGTRYSSPQRAITCQTQDWLDGTSTCTVGSFVKPYQLASIQ